MMLLMEKAMYLLKQLLNNELFTISLCLLKYECKEATMLLQPKVFFI